MELVWIMSENELIVFRITEVEKKMEALDKQLDKTNEHIAEMQVKIAQMNAYCKQICDGQHCERPRITGDNGTKMWAKVVMELIRALITISSIIAGVELLT